MEERLAVAPVAQRLQKGAVQHLVAVLVCQRPVQLDRPPPEADIAQPVEHGGDYLVSHLADGAATGLPPQGGPLQPTADLLLTTLNPGGQGRHRHALPAGQNGVLRLIRPEHEVEGQPVVRAIAVVAVAAEVAGPHMQLHVPLEGAPGGLDHRIAEVGTGATSPPSPVEHPQGSAGRRGQGLGREPLAIP